MHQDGAPRWRMRHVPPVLVLALVLLVAFVYGVFSMPPIQLIVTGLLLLALSHVVPKEDRRW